MLFPGESACLSTSSMYETLFEKYGDRGWEYHQANVLVRVSLATILHADYTFVEELLLTEWYKGFVCLQDDDRSILVAQDGTYVLTYRDIRALINEQD